MLPNTRKVSKGPLGPGLRLLALTLGLVVIIVACGGPETVAPVAPETEVFAPNSATPTAPDAESVAAEPTAPPTPKTDNVAPVPTPPTTPEMESVDHEPTSPAMPEAESVAPAPTPSAMLPTERVAPAPVQSATPDAESVAPEATAPATPPATPEAESVAPTPLATRPTESVAPTPIQSARPEEKSVAPESTALATPPATPDAESVAPGPIQVHSIHPPAHYGAATPSVEERIYDSDVIVRASLQSSGAGFLRFRVIEYLKGTGPVDITVNTSTFNRNTAWDDREAVLFLSMPEEQATSGATGSAGEAAAGEFVFTEAYDFTHPIYKGRSKLPTGYTIDSRDPAWLPSEAAGGASGTAAPASDPAFITDSAAATGGSPPTISLSDLRSEIAWVEGGNSIEGYDQCINYSIDSRQKRRDWAAYYGTPWIPYQSKRQVPSGAGEGAVVRDREYSRSGDLEYIRFRLSGQDADLFKSQIIDDDAVASNGYNHTITTARPLPRRLYRFFKHTRPPQFTPCDYTPDKPSIEHLVTAVAPDSAVHEAFFDPVAIGEAVGADAANGVLKPASFSLTDGGSTVTLSKIAWESGRATVELDPSLSLADHHADFIALDGTVSLRLDFDDAAETVDGTKRTLDWNVCAQPWESGDLLMLRISSSGENLTGVTNDGPCS